MNARDKELWSTVCQSEMPELDETCMTLQRQTKFADLIRADEREACAKVCDDAVGTWTGWPQAQDALAVGAIAIRARKNA